MNERGGRSGLGKKEGGGIKESGVRCRQPLFLPIVRWDVKGRKR